MAERLTQLLMVGAIAAVINAITTSASASYTECTVTKDTQLAIRPGGPSEPRYAPVNKGDKVAYRNQYQAWWFVLHYSDNNADYGWLPRAILGNCHGREGTP